LTNNGVDLKSSRVWKDSQKPVSKISVFL
jgi:hypothetical protein